MAEQILSADRGESDGPTDAQLEEVRRRYLVHQALDAEKASAWRDVRHEANGELFTWGLLAVYRLTVFAAACVVLWRYLAPG